VSNVSEKQIYRIIDANFNRTKEGLRVCEDVCRFVLNQKDAINQYKKIRHQVTRIICSLKINKIIAARNVQGDLGRGSINVEFKRRDVSDIFYANSQRVKESIRVLEEFLKILNKKKASEMKEIRYKIYELEKKSLKKL